MQFSNVGMSGIQSVPFSASNCYIPGIYKNGTKYMRHPVGRLTWSRRSLRPSIWSKCSFFQYLCRYTLSQPTPLNLETIVPAVLLDCLLRGQFQSNFFASLFINFMHKAQFLLFWEREIKKLNKVEMVRIPSNTQMSVHFITATSVRRRDISAGRIPSQMLNYA